MYIILMKITFIIASIWLNFVMYYFHLENHCWTIILQNVMAGYCYLLQHKFLMPLLIAHYTEKM